VIDETVAASQHARLLPFSEEQQKTWRWAPLSCWSKSIWLAARIGLLRYSDRDEIEEGGCGSCRNGNAMIMLTSYNSGIVPVRSVRAVDRMEDDFLRASGCRCCSSVFRCVRVGDDSACVCVVQRSVVPG
jgi:hypothetical protein